MSAFLEDTFRDDFPDGSEEQTIFTDLLLKFHDVFVEIIVQSASYILLKLISVY